MDEQFAVALAATVSLFSAWLVYYHLKVFSFWSSRGVKGPMPWPMFGTNVYYLFRNKLDVDADWHAKYGKVYGIYEGYLPTLRIADNKLIKHIYIKEFASFTDRNSRAVHGDNAKSWLLWSKGAYWANQRAMITPMFTSSKMRLMFNKMSVCVDNFLQEAESRSKQLDEQNKSNKSTSSGLDRSDTSKQGATKVSFVRRDLMNLTLDVIAQCFFSIKLNPYRETSGEFVKKAYGFSQVSLSRLLFWLLTPTVLARYFQIDLIAFSKFRYFDQLSQSIIDERRRSQSTSGAADSGRVDLMQAFLEAKIPDNYENIYTKEDDLEAHYNDQIKHDELEKIQEKQTKSAKYFRHFADWEIRGAMTFLFIAGFDTTASTIGFCVYELSHQPSIQEKIYHELIETLGQTNTGAKTTALDYTQLTSLKSLDAFVSEIMRLYSTLVENNRLVTAEEGAVLPTSPPVHLPKGTAISTNLFVLQRDPDYFERPEEFDMSRFYPENRDKIKSCTYMPFGIGPRNCAGMRFALMEIKLFLAKLLLEYSVAPGPNNQTYPPEFAQNLIFLQFKNTDFKLSPRR